MTHFLLLVHAFTDQCQTAIANSALHFLEIIISGGSRNFERGVRGRAGSLRAPEILRARPLPVARNAFLWPCAVRKQVRKVNFDGA